MGGLCIHTYTNTLSHISSHPLTRTLTHHHTPHTLIHTLSPHPLIPNIHLTTLSHPIAHPYPPPSLTPPHTHISHTLHPLTHTHPSRDALTIERCYTASLPSSPLPLSPLLTHISHIPFTPLRAALTIEKSYVVCASTKWPLKS